MHRTRNASCYNKILFSMRFKLTWKQWTRHPRNEYSYFASYHERNVRFKLFHNIRNIVSRNTLQTDAKTMWSLVALSSESLKYTRIIIEKIKRTDLLSFPSKNENVKENSQRNDIWIFNIFNDTFAYSPWFQYGMKQFQPGPLVNNWNGMEGSLNGTVRFKEIFVDIPWKRVQSFRGAKGRRWRKLTYSG